jgi:hypothetical protein
MGGRRGAYRVWMGRPEGKRPLGRPRIRWEDNIKMDFQKVEWGSWTGLMWRRSGEGTGFCGCGNEPLASIKCGEVLDYLRTW